MTIHAPETGLSQARFIPWLARFRRTDRGHASLELTRIDDDGTSDPRASEATADGVHLAFRGILFDRSELARQLRLESAPDGDASLILRAYRVWGEDGLRRLRGIFACFIWDAQRDRLLAVRDPTGLEPLFYARAGDDVVFAASPTVLRQHPGVSDELNRAALVEQLFWEYPVPEETCFRAIRRVLPGNLLTVTSGSAVSTRYWDPWRVREAEGWVEADGLDAFDPLLERAVARCVQLGTPGIFLSGGLDSVSIAAVALDLARRNASPVPVGLSIAFPTPETSELDVQVGVGRALGLPHLVLDLLDSVAPDGLVQRALALSADWPLPLTYLWAGAYDELARAAAEQHVRVIMTGGGGDEWLAVSPLLAADLMRQLELGALYRFVRSKFDSFESPLLPSLRSSLWKYGLRPILAYHVRLLLAEHAPEVLRARRRRQIARTDIPWLAADPKLRAEVRERRERLVDRAVERPKAGSRFRFYSSDGVTVLDHPLIAEDRESDHEKGRRAGVEFLHPYWDADLLSFLYRVPPELLLQGGLEKGLVRATVARRFPTLGFERQKKLLSRDYYYDVVRLELGNALRRMGGCTALAELGIIDRIQAAAVIDRGLASSNIREVHRVWQLATVETWVRKLL